jgi:hypothetical protein
MAGPETAAEAIVWIQEAMAAGNRISHPYFLKRCAQKGYRGAYDAELVIKSATRCRRYHGRQVVPGSTQWSVFGTLLDGETARVGVETYMDGTKRMVLLFNMMTGGEE